MRVWTAYLHWPIKIIFGLLMLKKKSLAVTEKTSENPNGYWCQLCGKNREWAERWCSSARCKERRDEEDELKARGFNSKEELYQHYRDTLANL